ncbi:hypothetical protein BEL55_004359 [Salmonella enterica subsp. enterica serovar Waycross]|nr:hypothetical protein [Salmonella enterica subsp. enterica serovar Waycross]
MRLTSHKKKILSYFEPDNREWVTGETGAPRFDIIGVAWLIYGIESHDKRHCLGSTRRTPEAMVKDGLLEKPISYEQRQNRKYASSDDGIWCKASRYGLPGQYIVIRDSDGKNGAIDGKCVRLHEQMAQ